MRTAGSGPDSPSTAIFATLPVTASSHPGNLGLGRVGANLKVIWEISDHSAVRILGTRS